MFGEEERQSAASTRPSPPPGYFHLASCGEKFKYFILVLSSQQSLLLWQFCKIQIVCLVSSVLVNRIQ